MLKDIDIYNKVVTKLIEQDERCSDEEHNCRYRGWKDSTKADIKSRFENPFGDDYDQFISALYNQTPDLKCAVGHLITDELYSPNIETRTVDSEIFDIVQKSNPDWEISDKSFVMLQRFQHIHDNVSVAIWQDFLDKMKDCFDNDGNFVDYIFSE